MRTHQNHLTHFFAKRNILTQLLIKNERARYDIDVFNIALTQLESNESDCVCEGENVSLR